MKKYKINLPKNKVIYYNSNDIYLEEKNKNKLFNEINKKQRKKAHEIYR